MKDEASGAGVKYKEAEVMTPKVLLYVPWRDTLYRIPASIPGSGSCGNTGFGSFPIPGTKDKACFAAVHIISSAIVITIFSVDSDIRD